MLSRLDTSDVCSASEFFRVPTVVVDFLMRVLREPFLKTLIDVANVKNLRTRDACCSSITASWACLTLFAELLETC